jgi:formate hydrogenlyase transcriptional activator
MATARESLSHTRPRVQSAQNEAGLFSGESVLNILKLILAGSPLAEVLTIIARLVESLGINMFCTIWLPSEDGSQLRCEAAPSLPGFAAQVGPTLVGPKGASSLDQRGPSTRRCSFSQLAISFGLNSP